MQTALQQRPHEELGVAKEEKEQMKIVIVGHVDHGKSTLVGRLFHDTNSLPDGKFEQIKASCEKRGMPFEWSFLLDALQAERDQGITIDTTQMWFKTQKRDYVIIDAPGHKEFLKNMISGAANAEAALLIIDAKEGVKEQSKRHGYLLHLLGIKQITVVVNKMDLVDYSEKAFNAIEKEYRAYLKDIGVEPTYVIPISAREGINITQKGGQQAKAGDNQTNPMKWYKGPAITDSLDGFHPIPALTDLPARLPVQDVYKFDERRIIAGRMESGSFKVGDTVLFSPSNKTNRIKSIESWPEHDAAPEQTTAGQSVGITLEDQIFVERGDIISHFDDAPKLTNIFKARIVWLGYNPLEVGKRYKIKLGTAEYSAEVREILDVLDTDNLSHSKKQRVERHAIGEVVFRIRGMATVDDFANHPKLGRFVIIEAYDVVGGGIIDTDGIADQRVGQTAVKSKNIVAEDFAITPEQRAIQNGHLGGILWFTGLSGSGKSTLARELHQRLFKKGYQVYVLDGDNVRGKLNKDLGFSPEDRTENIRRVGEVAALLADAGFIVISSFISPYAEDRRRARNASPEHFHTVYIKASVQACEKRDKKGLYKKARAGEIKEFTGISAPYEEPDNPDITVDTEKESLEESVQQLADYVEKQFIEPLKTPDTPQDYAGGGI